MSKIMSTYMNYSGMFSVQKILFILFEPHEWLWCFILPLLCNDSVVAEDLVHLCFEICE